MTFQCHNQYEVIDKIYDFGVVTHKDVFEKSKFLNMCTIDRNDEDYKRGRFECDQ